MFRNRCPDVLDCAAFVSTELHARIYMYTAQRHGMFAQMENVLTLLHADMQLFDSTVNFQASCAVEHGVAPFGGSQPKCMLQAWRAESHEPWCSKGASISSRVDMRRLIGYAHGDVATMFVRDAALACLCAHSLNRVDW